MSAEITLNGIIPIKAVKNPKCKGNYDAYSGEYGCEYETSLSCEECKYSGLPGARKNPEAKANAL